MRNKPIKVLYVNGGLMDRGGISSVMMSYYLEFDLRFIYVDFVVHGDGIGERDEEILQRGGKIFRVPPKSKNPIANYNCLKKIMKNGKYDIVHSHADSGNALILKIAKECGINIRISHSHNTDYTVHNRLRNFLNNIQKNQISKYATHKWACSKKAGEWLYGKKESFVVIPNAIDVAKFTYNSKTRAKYREKYGLEGKMVIGHIGRFDYQKNQRFLVETFVQALKERDDIRLVLIGDGKDKPIIERIIKENCVEDKILLMGKRYDVNSILNMFDLFVLPSKFEGLPVVMVEAQANGLKCVCSDLITREVNLTGNVIYLPLDIFIWSKEIIKTCERDNACLQKIVNSGYEINSAAEKVQEQYLKMVD